MVAERTKRKAFEPVGPFAPPLPSEVDQEGAKPMAVAGDEDAQQDAFKPTTAPKDQMSAEVARKYRDPQMQKASDVGRGSPTPHGQPPERRADENKRAEDPEGYKAAPRDGYRELEEP